MENTYQVNANNVSATNISLLNLDTAISQAFESSPTSKLTEVVENYKIKRLVIINNLELDSLKKYDILKPVDN